MADEPQPGTDTQAPDPNDFLPFERDANDQPTRAVGPVPANQFKYIGQALKADEFTAYVQNYNFGQIPPDFIVLHHSAIPGTVAAHVPNSTLWDGGEDGLSEDQIKQRRLGKLAGLREYYRTQLFWDAGPHLYIDDRYIHLFTPMSEIGIHAKWANSFKPGGKLHYSIGIEVIGYYERLQWPAPVARLVGHAVAVLKRRLGTFELKYMYPNGNPGMIGTGDQQRCAHPERLTFGGLSSHRDYNKPQCPGAAITEDFYVGVINAAWQRLMNPGQDDVVHSMSTTPQPAPGTYRITADTANIRQGPGTSFPVALNGQAKLAKDTQVEFDTINDGEAVNGDQWWGHLKDGTGFVSLELAAPIAVTGKTSTEVNLRANAGADQAIVQVLAQGTPVMVLQDTQTVDGGTWVKVRVGQVEGWVNQHFLA